jgi:D-alanyl-D-alanine carboxypeptidase
VGLGVVQRNSSIVSRAGRPAAVLLAAALAVGVTTAPAVAQRAVIVVDANSGRVVHEEQADAMRYPASLTKVMTLYLLFEQLEAGRLRLSSRLNVSANAARQPPTRLGVRAGETVTVEDAILALITRSANDVSVVVAENLAGSVEAFAARMTQRARQLGMSRTTFRNPHGLPDPEQRTTARDLSVLGRAIYERFPRYSRYFSRRSFSYGRRVVVGHNRLLGRIAAVDGIKTGYTRASGYNLLTSARVDGRHLVAVVMGGRTGAIRDAEMARLVTRHLPQMATRRTDFTIAQRVRGGRAVSVVAQREEPESEASPARVAATPPRRPVDLATRVREAIAAAEPVREENVAAPVQLAAVPPRPVERPRPQIVPVPAPAPIPAAEAPEPAPAAPPAPVAAPAPAPQPVEPPRELRPAPQPTRVASIAAGPVMQWQVGPQPVAREEPITTASTAQRAVNAAAAATTPPPVAAARAEPTPTGWVVQIAATNSETEAQRMLREARDTLGRRFAATRPVTEAVQRGSATLYRARLAGFGDRSAAEAACQVLRRNDYECMPIRL